MKVPGYPAAFDDTRTYRYALWRVITPVRRRPSYAMFIGLNPSTADEVTDDPTIRRCVGYARRWGFNALCMTNIFALRSTDPGALYGPINPIGEANDWWLSTLARKAGIIVCAWGVHGKHMGRGHIVATQLIKQGHSLSCLSITNGGHPGHPLYLPGNAEPKLYLPINAIR